MSQVDNIAPDNGPNDAPEPIQQPALALVVPPVAPPVGAPVGAPAPAKKRPGRPRKKVDNITVEAYGIVTTPTNEEDILEMVYCNPVLFKKLLTLFKSYECSKITMIFEAHRIRYIAKDHLDKSLISIEIVANKLNYYYCKETITISVRRENLEKILRTLDKSHYKITFILRENFRSTLYVIMKEFQYDKDSHYEIEVMPDDPNAVNAQIEDDTNYPLKFTFDSKHFKKVIGDIGNISPVFTILKAGDENLQFTYEGAKKVNYNGIYKNPQKIKLASKIDPNDIFSISTYIDYIKPLSNSNIGDEVTIAAHQHKKLSFTTLLDRKDDGYVCTLKVFTEIKAYQAVENEEVGPIENMDAQAADPIDEEAPDA